MPAPPTPDDAAPASPATVGHRLGRRGLEQRDADPSRAGRAKDLDTDVVEPAALGLTADAAPTAIAMHGLALERGMVGELPDRRTLPHSGTLIVGHLTVAVVAGC